MIRPLNKTDRNDLFCHGSEQIIASRSRRITYVYAARGGFLRSGGFFHSNGGIVANTNHSFRRWDIGDALTAHVNPPLVTAGETKTTKVLPGTVLFVIGSMRIGGTEKQLVLLADELVQRGWRVEIFCLEGHGPLSDSALSAKVRIHSGGWDSLMPFWRKIMYLLRAQWRLIVLTLRLRADVIHAFLPLTNFLGAVAGRLTFRPLVITSRRALGTHRDKHRIWIAIDWIANCLSDIVTANSKAVAADTISRDGVDVRKLKVIYNGIDTTPFETSRERRAIVRAEMGITPEAIVIGSISNLVGYKGHRDLISAFATVTSGKAIERKSMTLLLAGEDRGIGESLARQAREFGVSDQIRFLGCCTDVSSILAATDIGVLSSYEESISNALLEMLAAGLPVVATRVGGNHEALADMTGCLLVPPADPVALAAAIGKIVVGLPERPERPLSRVDLIRTRFPIGAMVSQYERLYRDRE
jgi:glycosyltransferase involved in cell wall biosynthesis